MVLVDGGPGLRAALRQIAQRPPSGGTLFLLAPFIEARTALWRSALAIARAGVQEVLLFTRPTRDQCVLGCYPGVHSRRRAHNFSRESSRNGLSVAPAFSEGKGGVHWVAQFHTII